MLKLYLDNCCFNRPFDDQSHFRIRIETEAKLLVQEGIRSGYYSLVWSYILDYENYKNPYQDRYEQIDKWRNYACDDIDASDSLIQQALIIESMGIKQMDALHIACALQASSDYFLTTDKGILKYAERIESIDVLNPIDFIQEMNP